MVEIVDSSRSAQEALAPSSIGPRHDLDHSPGQAQQQGSTGQIQALRGPAS